MFLRASTIGQKKIFQSVLVLCENIRVVVINVLYSGTNQYFLYIIKKV